MLMLVSMSVATTQAPNAESLAVDDAELARWQDMRFGMFIHWGPVTLKGTELGWSRGTNVPREEYDQLYKNFNPVYFDAEEWVSIAKDAGMRYVVFTSKHHDGFCMWETKTTDYNIMNTPFARDVIKELAEACKKEGIAFGTYYSILDWYQPDYNTANTHGGPGYTLPDSQTPSMERFQEYIESHIRELVENYGPLHTMWFDGEWEDPWTQERGLRLFKFCRELDPHMLVNNRAGKARKGMEGVTASDALAPGDYDTPEQQVGAFNDQRPWETCMTIGNQWSWKPDDRIKSFKVCIQTLVQTVGGDGNLLFNVGPSSDGRIEPDQVATLREMGAWLRQNGSSIYGTRGGPFLPGRWGCSTRKDNLIYIHAFKWKNDLLKLPPLEAAIQSAALLNGPDIQFIQNEKGVKLRVPIELQDDIDTIIRLNIK